jgi:mannosyltransferase
MNSRALVRRISEPGWSNIALLGILVIGTWLRFRNLSADSIWLDEAESWRQSKGSLADLSSATAEDNYPPLHNLLLFAFIKVSGTDTEWVLRAPSALLGVANIVAIYWLGAPYWRPDRWRLGGSNLGDLRLSH